MVDIVLPHALPRILEHHKGVKALSLDCFDTLIWRDTHAPHDLFTCLCGVSQRQRVSAEMAARKAKRLSGMGGEPTLAEIHARLSPTDADRGAALVAEELALEARHCFAFAPTVALIRAARRAGLRVVVVSDTYLPQAALRTLIEAGGGRKIAAMIDAIYCSCDHGRSKAEGLLADMLASERLAAHEVLHIGDNPVADAEAAIRLGIQHRHLVQFSPSAVQRLRLEAATAALLDPRTAPVQPHRASIAVGEPRCADSATQLGFGVVGPILVPFAQWVDGEAKALNAATGGRVHRLFLMRDGHLPRLTYRALHFGARDNAVEISRFTAIAAGLRDTDSIARFLDAELGDDSGADLLRQLLLSEAEIAEVLTTHRGPYALRRALLDRPWIETIAQRGTAIAERLIAHIRSTVHIEPGDTVLLIDLGYNGTVQDHVAPLIEGACGAHVAGRYLLLRETVVGTMDKRGFIDARTFDAGVLDLLASNIALLEQLCTVSQGSVIDYREDGRPVRAKLGIKARQSAVREQVQRGCVKYAQQHGTAVLRSGEPPALVVGPHAAAAALGRMLCLPLPEEIEVLRAFEHDVNLGEETRLELFDTNHAAVGLRREGLFYLKHKDRMCPAAELRGQGLATSLAYIAQSLFGLDLRYADFCDGGFDLPILLASGANAFADQVRATPTHDGFFAATIPVGRGEYSVGIQFGRIGRWFEIDTIEFIPADDYLSDRRSARAAGVAASPIWRGMSMRGANLFACEAGDGMMMVPPPCPADRNQVLRVIFRPIGGRDDIAVAATALSCAA